jgi:hypothetical protein
MKSYALRQLENAQLRKSTTLELLFIERVSHPVS